MCLLELKNISKYYKLKGSEKFHVLDNVNLAFNKEFLWNIWSCSKHCYKYVIWIITSK